MIRHTFDLIRLITATELKQRYSGSVLGCIWVLLKPLFLFLILNFVFSRIFASNDRFYSVKLLSALLTWNLFSEASTLAMTSLVGHASILTKAKMPMWIFVTTSALSAAINYSMTVIVLFAFCLGYDSPFTAMTALRILGIGACAFALAVGVGLASAPLFVRYRDLNQIWEVALTAGFYFSPIIYPLSLIPKQYHIWSIFNPLTYPISYVKSAIAGEPFADMHKLTISVAAIGIFLVLSIALFWRTSRQAAEHL